MLRGAQSINLDAKGRMAIPTKYRDWLQQDADGQLVCTIDIHNPCLLLYPLPEWELIEAQLRKLSSMNPTERRFQRLLLGYASECELDKTGRILINGPLRNHAGLEKKVMLIGQLNKFEIWDESRWEAQITADLAVDLESDLALSQRLQDFSL